MKAPKFDISQILVLIALVLLVTFLIVLRPSPVIENLIPYEIAMTLPPPKNSITAKLNPMPNSHNGPFPSQNPNMMREQ